MDTRLLAVMLALLATAQATFAAHRRPPVVRHHHHRPHVYYYGSVWWGYPGPYYYGGYYDPGYRLSPAVPAAPVVEFGENVSESFRNGYLWGMDRRLRLVTKKETRKALRSFWPTASQQTREDFRRGFAAGYGAGGEAEFDKLLAKAKLTR